MSITFKVGELTVHRVIEQEGPLFNPLDFFPTLTQELLDENRNWLVPTFVDKASGQLMLCIQSYIVQTPHHNKHEFSDVVKLIPTPGHTIDHFSVHIGKPGADAVISGDMIHSPIQARYPELSMRVDHHPEQGIETRRELFGRLCDTSTLLCTAHFPSPSKGRLTRWGDGFRITLV